MTQTKLNALRPLAGLMALTILLGGCPEKKKNAYEIDSASASEANAKLAKADAYDGTTDKIVSRCAGCELGMAGSPDHTITVSGYTLYFCSDSCQSAFGEDVTKSVLAMEVPEKGE